MADNNTPAFPTDETSGDGTLHIKHHLGLTKREYAAIEMAKAIIGDQGTSAEITFEEVARRAYKQADALLAFPMTETLS